MPAVLSRRVQFWFMVVMVALLVTTVVCWQSIQALRTQQERVRDAGNRIERLAGLVALARDAESGQCGYIITGKDPYLLPYNEARESIENYIVWVDATYGVSGTNTAEHAHRLTRVVRDKLSELAETVEIRRTKGFDAAATIVNDDRGRLLMLEAISIVRTLQANERKKLTTLESVVERTAERGALALLLLALLDVALLVSLIGTVKQDLLLLKRAEATAHTNAERYRAIFDTSAAGLCELEAETFRFDRVNTRLCQLTGYAEEELLRMTLGELVHSDDAAEVTESFEQIIRCEVPDYRVTKRCVRKDQHIIWVQIDARARRDESAKPVHVVAVIQDVTEQRRTREEIERMNLALEDRVRDRTADFEAFSYTVSHDLRAPLRGMHGFAQALVEDFGDALGELGRQDCARIMSAAVHMERLIEDQLAYSRLGRENVDIRPVNLQQIVEEALQLVSTELEEAHAEVTVESTLPTVLAYRPVLIQVIQNLLANATKFVPQGSRPRIRIWSDNRPGGFVRLWIEDNGIGIAEEHRERIFKVFERLHSQDIYPGTGIGLAIVRRGMERMKGSAGVDSVVAEGSKFWLELKKLRREPYERRALDPFGRR